MLTPGEIRDIWASGAGERNALAKMQTYYEGKQLLGDISFTRKDGVARSHIVVNWFDYVTACHVGFMTSERAEYTTPDEDQSAGLAEFLAVYNDNDLQADGIEHLTNAVVYGHSVEVHSFDGKEIKITATRPEDWVLVRDEFDKIMVGVYRAKIPAFQYFRGQLLPKEKTVFYVYDADSVTLYEETENTRIPAVLDQRGHSYKRPPLVEFSISRDRSSHFKKSFIDNANAYCVTRSLLQDEIKINIDALLATQGVNAKAFMEKDENGKTALQHIKETGLMVLPEGATATWLTRNLDIAKFERDLEYSRFAIHQQGAVPDISQSLSKGGAVSQISGVALKLLYQPMLQKSAQFATYYKKGLRDRIALFNTVQEMLSRPTLDNVEIKINQSLPQNSVEWAQYLPALLAAGGISRAAAVRQLDFIDNPEQVLAEIDADRELETGTADRSKLKRDDRTRSGYAKAL